MPLWMLIVILATLVKLPIAALLLWMPFRNDEAMRAPDTPDSSDDDGGGSKTLPGGSRDPRPRAPLPRSPRRGPHGSPAPPSPRRIRTTVTAVSRRPAEISH
jgi:hypothetical protein